MNVDASLTALRLAEEQACARYLAARKAQIRLGARVGSLAQLVAEQPQRADYRAARDRVVEAHGDAVQRTRLAYLTWQRAQRRADAMWTATEGRTPVARPSADAAGGRVA
jgi:hypothetical protein